jgi:hypothetical protein
MGGFPAPLRVYARSESCALLVAEILQFLAELECGGLAPPYFREA